jgi:hypothetical protein
MKNLFLLLLLCGLSLGASAALLDDFESYAPGEVRTVARPPWFEINASTTAAVIEADAVTGNKYAKAWYLTSARGMSRPLGALSIPNTSTASTLSLRVRAESAGADSSFGLSDDAASSSLTWGNFEVQIAIISNTLRIRNAGVVFDTTFPITPGTWYNIWAVINNTTDTTDLYAAAEGQAPARVAAGMKFRNSGTTLASNSLVTFQFLNNSGSRVQIDDIAITDGIAKSLIAPGTPTPANNAAGVLQSTSQLTWLGGLDPNNVTQLNPAIKKYYIRTTEDNAAGNDTLVLQETQTVSGTDRAASYTLGTGLEFGRTYYWQVEQGMDKGDGTAFPAGEPNNVLSPVWSFTVQPATPSNLVGPASVKGHPGETVQLSVTFTSVNPVTSVTWYKDNVALNTATDPDLTVTFDDTATTLTIANVSAADEGVYSCEVTNTGGTTPSGTGQLRLKKLLAHYKFEQDLNDSVGTNHATLVGPAAGMQYAEFNIPGKTPGKIAGQYYAADPNGGVHGLLTTEAYPKAGFGNGLEEGTFSVWVKAAPATAGTIFGQFNGAPGSSDYKTAFRVFLESTGVVRFHLRDDDVNQLQPAGTKAIGDDKWHLVTVTYSASQANLYVDGGNKVTVTSAAPLDNFAAWQYPMTLMALNNRSSVQGLFSGMLDDLKILNYMLTPEEVAQAYYDVTGDAACIYTVAEVPGLAYDLTGDCQVNLADFAILAAKWLESGLYPN